jgi:fatty-acid desaturase
MHRQKHVTTETIKGPSYQRHRGFFHAHLQDTATLRASNQYMVVSRLHRAASTVFCLDVVDFQKVKAKVWKMQVERSEWPLDNDCFELLLDHPAGFQSMQ